MSKIHLVSCFVFFFFSYQSIAQYYKDYPQRISALPTLPSFENKIEMFYPDEGKTPTKPFIKVVELTSAGRAYANTAAELVLDLIKQAHQIGVDAVVEIKQSSFEREAQIDGIWQMITYKQLSGIGIKYTDNLAYLKYIPKTQLIYQLDKDTREKLIGEMHFSPNNEIIEVKGIDENAQVLCEEQVKNFSLAHLLYEQNNWRYIGDIHLPTKRALYRLNDWILKRCNFMYDEYKKLVRIRVIDPRTNMADVIKFTYNEQGKIKEKIIQTKTNKRYKEVFQYDDNLVLRSILHYDETERRKPKLIMRSVVQYYNQEDFIPLIEAQTIR